MQERNEIILYLEQNGFINSGYSQDIFLKNKIFFRFTRFREYCWDIHRAENIHRITLSIRSDFEISYDRISFFYDFLECAYEESLKLRKEKTQADREFDETIYLSPDKEKFFIKDVRLDKISNKHLSRLFLLDMKRVKYEIIYRYYDKFSSAL